MTREYLADDVEQLRRELPLDWVLAECGRAAVARGRYFCLNHPDEETGNPSADIWEGDDGERLGCWSCGAIRDVFEVIEESIGCSPSDAVAWARDRANLAPEKQPRAAPRQTVSAVRLELELERTTTGIRWPGDVDPIRRFGLARAEAGHHLAPVSYLRDEWEWRGDFKGRVLIPHRRYDETLTGIRYRLPSRWQKSSRAGSEFRQLYGGWRLAAQQEVWLCEGETDATWVAWHLEGAGLDATAVALGTATQRVRPDELQLLEGRLVVLALDADEAGSGALERWRRELGAVAGKLVELRLDAGHDLCSCVESPLELRRLYA